MTTSIEEMAIIKANETIEKKRVAAFATSEKYRFQGNMFENYVLLQNPPPGHICVNRFDVTLHFSSWSSRAMYLYKLDQFHNMFSLFCYDDHFVIA